MTNSEIEHQQAQATVDAIIRAKGLQQINDTAALEALIDQALARSPAAAAGLQAGDSRAINALIGRVMLASHGAANPERVRQLLEKRLSEGEAP